MLVYKVHHSESSAPSALEKSSEIDILLSEYMSVTSSHKRLPVNTSGQFQRYGVMTAPFEIDYFHAHRDIWRLFEATGEPCCLILEAGVRMDMTAAGLLEHIGELPEDWDIIFPFDKLEEAYAGSRTEIHAGMFGFFWGAHIYFLSRQGALKLLSISEIRQPLDEELLELSFKDVLNTYFVNTGAFYYDEASSPSLQARTLAIRHALKNFPAWQDKDKVLARRLLQTLSRTAADIGIPLVLHGGTLLGYVRHGGIMPWDDDIDLGIHHTLIRQLLQTVEKQGVMKYEKIFHQKPRSASWFYKFWLDEGHPIEGYEYKFPFIDVWLYYEKEQEVYYEEGYNFPKDAYLPFQDADFEGSLISAPAEPMRCLDALYSDWRQYIKIYTWSHRLERPAFRPLKIKIEIDASGKAFL